MAAPTASEPAPPPGATAEAPSHHLVILGLDSAETRRLDDSGHLSIGRDEQADVRIVDALASRHHARLHQGPTIEIEDLGSANGTRLRDELITPNRRVAVAPGEAITIGTTVLLVQRRAPAFRPRRIWPHAYFETRLIETCGQAETAHGAFALVRLRGSNPETWERDLVQALRPGDVLASYAPGEYEILLIDTDRHSAGALIGELARIAGSSARAGVAFFPGDGTSPQALASAAGDRLRDPAAPSGVVLVNAAMREVHALAEKVARGTINVLILGETGVGKEILAQAVHRASPRSGRPFVCLNCAALSDALLESELFGHEKGAFTGAVQAKVGLLEAASSGTLFLDEIGEMPLGLQAKILRAIEAREILRVGATRPRAVDVRFVAATNRDLEEEVAARRFRPDLYFRLNGVSLPIPPLRERIDEVPPLARLFLDRVAGHGPPLSAEVIAELCAYAWPGNVRELRNVMERAILLSGGGTIQPEHLPLDRMRRRQPGATPAPPPTLRMAEIERQAMVDALVRCAGNQTRAAELLGIPRRTFCTRLREYRIARPRT
jgi:two-component system response regulator AtoC